MSMFQRLLDQLKERGLSVGPGDKPGELKLHGPTKERTPEIMKALKAFKPQLVEKFGKREGVTNGTGAPPTSESADPESESCPVCNRTIGPQERQRMTDPAFCDRGANPRCPFKPWR